MAVQEREGASLLKPLKLIGLGFWQAWWMCAMCSPAVIPIDAAIGGLDARFVIQLATDFGYLGAILASRFGRIPSFRSIPAMLPLAAGAFSLGTFMLMISAYLSDELLRLIVEASACLCILCGNALLLFLWGELWSTLATGRVGRHLYLSYLFAFVLFFLGYALPQPLDGLLTCAFPLASALIYASCRNEPRRQAPAQPLSLRALPIGGFLGMTILASLVYGVSQTGIPLALGADAPAGVSPPSMLFAGLCLGALVLNLSVANPESEVLKLFRNVIPVMSAGLVLTLLLPPAYAFVGNGLIVLGIYSLDMFLMLVSTDVALRTRTPVAQAFGITILTSRIGTLVGTFVAMMVAAQVGWDQEELRTALLIGLFCLVVAGMLLFNQSDLEKVYHVAPAPAARPSAEQHARELAARCGEIAKEYELTARESEVIVLLAQGKTVPEVCEELSIAKGTAKHHVSNIYRKVGVFDRRSLLELVEAAG